MARMIHLFDGVEHRWVEDPEEVRRERRAELVERVRARSAPELGPDGRVHNDFTAWLAMENAKRSVAQVGRHLEAIRC